MIFSIWYQQNSVTLHSRGVPSGEKYSRFPKRTVDGCTQIKASEIGIMYLVNDDMRLNTIGKCNEINDE